MNAISGLDTAVAKQKKHIKCTVLCYIPPRNLVQVPGCFRGTCCLHLQCQKPSQAGKHATYSVYSSHPEYGASMFLRSTRCQIPDHSALHNIQYVFIHRLQNWISLITYFHFLSLSEPPLLSSGHSSWLQIQRSRVRFPALPDFLRIGRSGTGSTQPREDNWGATWKENSGSELENRN
jgi:hypothetical protein